MTWSHALAERIRRGQAISAPLSLALSAATPITRAGMWTRKLRSPVRVNARVISIGNITAGGTGKTPAVIRLIDQLSRDAQNVIAVLTRGYGTGTSSRIIASCDVPPGRQCEVLGDEPALILKKHPHVLLLKGRNRVEAARLAIDTHGCNTLILDDGFQFVQLHRDVDQVLIDATNPFGNGRLIPRGILREPLHALKRSTEIVLTRCDQASELSEIEQTIRRYTSAPISRTAHRPVALLHLRSGELRPLNELAGSEIAVACAVGNPEAFIASIAVLGANIRSTLAYPDHAHIPIADIPQDIPVVITEKDAVKLTNPPDNLYALVVSLEPFD